LNHRPQHYECWIDIFNLLFLLLFQGICSQFEAPKVLQSHGKSLQNPYSGVEGG
jgi:hypothetical protein